MTIPGSFKFPLFAIVAFFFALWFVLCRHLSVEWSVNEQYSYGWFVPFFALYLFWLRWESRPKAGSYRLSVKSYRAEQEHAETNNQELITNNSAAAAAIGAVGICCLLLLFPLRLFEIGTPEWRPLAWLHAGVVVALTLILIWRIGAGAWLRHFAFPVAFIFVAVPWITPIETPIIQGLMRGIAAAASETLNLFGVPARFEGNLIRVSSGLVGVNEACSGVRSLQTSLMIGLLFGELKRLSILRRGALLGGAIAIALLANFARTLFLVWIAAAKNVSEIARWHDLAGYAIVAVVFIGSLSLAQSLNRNKVESRKTKVENKEESRPESTSYLLLPPFYFAAALVWLLFVEFGAASWYRAHEKNLVQSARWDVHWPQSAPNFREHKIDEETRRFLRFDDGRAASWTIPPAETRSRALNCSIFFFRWNPGKNSALLANLHRPDVCLPAVGWEQIADTGVKNYAAGDSLALPFRHFEFRHGAPNAHASQVAHAFYCLWEDRESADHNTALLMANVPPTWTRGERFRAVLEGRRHLGQQVMELVLQTRGDLDFDEADRRFAQVLTELIKVESRK